jgi:peroxisomal trans-2-enoyl-CoA reductase
MSALSVFRPDLFAGTVALVTGGGSGIGKAIARELVQLGANVVIAARKRPRLDATAEELNALGGGRVHATTCNIRDEDEVRALMAETLETFGRIDFLVNNAGGQFPGPAAAIRTKGWNAVIETNLTGTFLCSREVFAAWMRDNGGSVVNIIADMWRGFPGMAHTGAARAGVDNLTKTLSVEWAPNMVRVNAVAPGIIMSSGFDTYDPFFQKAFIEMGANTPAQRLGTEEEVASCVLWLLSPGAAYTTGTTVRVDGGSSLYRQAWEIPVHASFPKYGGSEETGE